MRLFNYITSLIIPFTFMLIGFIFWRHSPKKINASAGWRTKQAMKNQETWDFANMLGGKCTLILGFIEFLITLIFLTFTPILNTDIFSILVLILVIVQAACFAIVHKYVDKRLKAHFHL